METFNYFIKIYGWMHEVFNLGNTEERVFALIYDCSKDGKSKCNLSQKCIARICNCSLSSVKRALNELKCKDLIKDEDILIDKVVYKKYWVTEKALNISKRKEMIK